MIVKFRICPYNHIGFVDEWTVVPPDPDTKAVTAVICDDDDRSATFVIVAIFVIITGHQAAAAPIELRLFAWVLLTRQMLLQQPKLLNLSIKKYSPQRQPRSDRRSRMRDRHFTT